MLVFFIVVRRVHRWISYIPGSDGDAQAVLLAISSPMDEAWQVLHHLPTIKNPLIVRSSLLGYLASSVHSRFFRGQQVARIRGARSYRDISIIQKGFAAFLDFWAISAIFALIFNYFGHQMDLFSHNLFSESPLILSGAMIVFIFPLVLRPLFGAAFYSAFLSPFRWCALRVRSPASVGDAFGTYIVRRWSWPVLLKMTMGLEGYPYKIPTVHQHKTIPVLKNFVK